MSRATVDRTSSRMVVERDRYVIPCDDGMGTELVILQAPDGDLHISLQFNAAAPNADESTLFYEQDEAARVLFAASVRIRSGVGGGANPRLYLDLVKALRAQHAEHAKRGGAPDA